MDPPHTRIGLGKDHVNPCMGREDRSHTNKDVDTQRTMMSEHYTEQLKCDMKLFPTVAPIFIPVRSRSIVNVNLYEGH